MAFRSKERFRKSAFLADSCGNKNKKKSAPAQCLKIEKDKTETFNKNDSSLIFVCPSRSDLLFFKVIILKPETNGKVK